MSYYLLEMARDNEVLAERETLLFTSFEPIRERINEIEGRFVITELIILPDK